MIRKLLTGGVAIAVAVAAVLLVTLGGGTGTAKAAINSIGAPSATQNAGALVTITIDADDGAGDVRVVTTSGTFIDSVCNGSTLVGPFIVNTGFPGTPGAANPAATTGNDCAIDATSANGGLDSDTNAPFIQDVTFDDGPAAAAGGNMDTLQITLAGPATGPATASVTAIQGTSSRSVNVTFRGNAARLDFKILEAAPAGLTAANAQCTGDIAEVIAAVGTTAGGAQGFGLLCTLVFDSANNRLPNQPVIYSTTAGSFGGTGLTDTTGNAAATPATCALGVFVLASGNPAICSTITAGSTGTAGTTATVTASSGGVTATQTVKFGGDPASCTATANPTTVQVGGSSTITVAVRDSTGGPSPDNIGVAIVQANPGAGANAAIIGGPFVLENGSTTAQVIAAIQGEIAIGATSPTFGPTQSTTCTTRVTATGTLAATATATGTGTATGTATSGTGTGTIVAGTKPPATGGFGLFVFGGGTFAQMETAACGSSTTDAYFVTNATGGFVQFVPQTTVTVVNAEWNTMFPGGTIPAGQPIIGKCA